MVITVHYAFRQGTVVAHKDPSRSSRVASPHSDGDRPRWALFGMSAFFWDRIRNGMVPDRIREKHADQRRCEENSSTCLVGIFSFSYVNRVTREAIMSLPTNVWGAEFANRLK